MKLPDAPRPLGLPATPSARPPAVRRLAWGLVIGLLLGGCAAGEAPAPAPPEPSALEGPPIREGVVTEAEAREAARLVREGETLLAEGDAAQALERAVEVVDRFPTAPGSSRALGLRARAAAEMEDWAQARAAAERYREIVPAGSAEAIDAAILRAETMRSGAMPGAIEAVFDIPEAVPDPELVDRTEALAEAWAAEMQTSELRDLAIEAPSHPIVLPVFLSELAVRRYFAGDREEARELAEEATALNGGPLGTERARRVLAGDLETTTPVAGMLGGLLPSVGSPTIRQLAQEIRDGVEVALAVEESDFARPIQFVPFADATSASDVAGAVRELSDQGAVGVIGPLEATLMEEAARARTSTFPIISPTARVVPDGLNGVYSLTGVDPGASETLARLALSRGVRSVVLLQTATPEMDQAAGWFREAYADGGGSVVRMLTYAPGATQFEAQMTEVIRLRPDGIVLFVPQQDVELVAPQLSYYGVDDLPGFTRLGNESWTSDAALAQVQPRHMDGVLSVTSWAESDGYGPGWAGFVEAYEEHFQRTLRSPTPALGYDAARLLSRAAREGGGSSEGTREALERIRGFPGATGLLSVTDGRIRREYTPVRIENRALVPLSP